MNPKLTRWARLAGWGALGIQLALPALPSIGVPGTQQHCLASYRGARKVNSSLHARSAGPLRSHPPAFA